MKSKIFFPIAVFVGVFISCTSDDSMALKSDPIVGDWNRVQQMFVFENDSVTINNFQNCSETNSFVFMTQEYDRAIALYYHTSVNESFPDPCQIVSAGGTWTKISDEKYSVHIDYFEETDPFNIGEETILYRASFPTPDSLILHNLNKLAEYQTEMEGLLDFYTVYKLDDGGIHDGPNFP